MPSVASLIVVVLTAALLVNGYEYDIIEGDIQVPKRGVTSQEHSFKQLGEWAGTTLWPGVQVAWAIDTASGLPANDARILAAIAHWEDKTCIDFRPRTNETNYLKFVFSNSSCSSPVGMNYRTYN